MAKILNADTRRTRFRTDQPPAKRGTAKAPAPMGEVERHRQRVHGGVIVPPGPPEPVTITLARGTSHSDFRDILQSAANIIDNPANFRADWKRTIAGKLRRLAPGGD